MASSPGAHSPPRPAPADPPSLVAGFALSLLGSVLLFLGQLASFAGVSRPLAPYHANPPPVLYTAGILVSLTGTGFLLGVSSPISPRLVLNDIKNSLQPN